MSNEQLREEVLDFLRQNHENPFEQFNKAFAFYKKSERKNRAIEATINRRGYSDQGLKNLIYDLKKMFNITDVEVLVPAHEKAEVIDFLNLSEEEQISLLNKLQNDGLETFLSSQTDEVKDLVASILKTETDKSFLEIISKKGCLNVSEAEKVEVISLRDEFPFLNDEKCPNILYVVVGKRITAYHNYVELHNKLKQVAEKQIELSDEEVEKLTFQCNAAEEENRALWDELNYYKENGKFLAKHPVFLEEKVKAEVEKMTTEKMFSLKSSSSKYFHDKKNALEKHKDDPEKISKINAEIERRRMMLELIDVKIGAAPNEKK